MLSPPSTRERPELPQTPTRANGRLLLPPVSIGSITSMVEEYVKLNFYFHGIIAPCMEVNPCVFSASKEEEASSMEYHFASIHANKDLLQWMEVILLQWMEVILLPWK